MMNVYENIKSYQHEDVNGISLISSHKLNKRVLNLPSKEARNSYICITSQNQALDEPTTYFPIELKKSQLQTHFTDWN